VAAGRKGSWSGGGDSDGELLVGTADRLRWRAPELALEFARQAATRADAVRDRALSLRANALVVAALVRLGKHAEAVEPAVRTLREAEAAGVREQVSSLRVDLAASTRAVGLAGSALVLVRPMLEGGDVRPAVRAGALAEIVAGLAQAGRRGVVDEVLSEADRLYAADETLTGDVRRMLRALLCARIASFRRRWGNATGAVAAATEGMMLLDGLSDPGAESGEARAELGLEMVSALLDAGELAAALGQAEQTLNQPIRATSAAATGRLMFVLATRVHIPEGRVREAHAMLADIVRIARRHGLDALLADVLTSLAHEQESAGELTDALNSLRSARAAEHRRLRADTMARLIVLEELGAGTKLPDDTEALLRRVVRSPSRSFADFPESEQPERSAPGMAVGEPRWPEQPGDTPGERDAETGLLNRQGLRRRLAAARRQTRPTALTLVRLDSTAEAEPEPPKSNDPDSTDRYSASLINSLDRAGNRAAQEFDPDVLSSLAGHVRDMAPEHSELVRPEEGELAVLMPDTTRDEAEQFAATLRETMSTSDWDLEDPARGVSVSTGVAEYEGTSEDVLLTAAREALTSTDHEVDSYHNRPLDTHLDDQLERPAWQSVEPVFDMPSDDYGHVDFGQVEERVEGYTYIEEYAAPPEDEPERADAEMDAYLAGFSLPEYRQWEPTEEPEEPQTPKHDAASTSDTGTSVLDRLGITRGSGGEAGGGRRGGGRRRAPESSDSDPFDQRPFDQRQSSQHESGQQQFDPYQYQPDPRTTSAGPSAGVGDEILAAASAARASIPQIPEPDPIPDPPDSPDIPIPPDPDVVPRPGRRRSTEPALPDPSKPSDPTDPDQPRTPDIPIPPNPDIQPTTGRRRMPEQPEPDRSGPDSSTWRRMSTPPAEPASPESNRSDNLRWPGPTPPASSAARELDNSAWAASTPQAESASSTARESAGSGRRGTSFGESVSAALAESESASWQGRATPPAESASSIAWESESAGWQGTSIQQDELASQDSRQSESLAWRGTATPPEESARQASRDSESVAWRGLSASPDEQASQARRDSESAAWQGSSTPPGEPATQASRESDSLAWRGSMPDAEPAGSEWPGLSAPPDESSSAALWASESASWQERSTPPAESASSTAWESDSSGWPAASRPSDESMSSAVSESDISAWGQSTPPGESASAALRESEKSARQAPKAEPARPAAAESDSPPVQEREKSTRRALSAQQPAESASSVAPQPEPASAEPASPDSNSPDSNSSAEPAVAAAPQVDNSAWRRRVGGRQPVSERAPESDPSAWRRRLSTPPGNDSSGVNGEPAARRRRSAGLSPDPSRPIDSGEPTDPSADPHGSSDAPPSVDRPSRLRRREKTDVGLADLLAEALVAYQASHSDTPAEDVLPAYDDLSATSGPLGPDSGRHRFPDRASAERDTH
jgi:GGDEF domain-containing protein